MLKLNNPKNNHTEKAQNNISINTGNVKGDTEKITSYRDIVVKRSNPKSNKNDSMKNDWAENKNKDTPQLIFEIIKKNTYTTKILSNYQWIQLRHKPQSMIA